MKNIRLRSYKDTGTILLSDGLITPERLREALDAHQKTGLSVGRALVELGSISEWELARAVAKELGVCLHPPAQHGVPVGGDAQARSGAAPPSPVLHPRALRRRRHGHRDRAADARSADRDLSDPLGESLLPRLAHVRRGAGSEGVGPAPDRATTCTRKPRRPPKRSSRDSATEHRRALPARPRSQARKETTHDYGEHAHQRILLSRTWISFRVCPSVTLEVLSLCRKESVEVRDLVQDDQPRSRAERPHPQDQQLVALLPAAGRSRRSRTRSSCLGIKSVMVAALSFSLTGMLPFIGEARRLRRAALLATLHDRVGRGAIVRPAPPEVQ